MVHNYHAIPQAHLLPLTTTHRRITIPLYLAAIKPTLVPHQQNSHDSCAELPLLGPRQNALSSNTTLTTTSITPLELTVLIFTLIVIVAGISYLLCSRILRVRENHSRCKRSDIRWDSGRKGIYAPKDELSEYRDQGFGFGSDASAAMKNQHGKKVTNARSWWLGDRGCGYKFLDSEEMGEDSQERMLGRSLSARGDDLRRRRESDDPCGLLNRRDSRISKFGQGPSRRSSSGLGWGSGAGGGFTREVEGEWVRLGERVIGIGIATGGLGAAEMAIQGEKGLRSLDGTGGSFHAASIGNTNTILDVASGTRRRSSSSPVQPSKSSIGRLLP